MLSFLLDENVSPAIATQIRHKQPDISVASVHSWQDGRCIAQPDEVILAAAGAEGLTLVTYDQKTILPLLAQWSNRATEHAGVVFTDNLTIASNDFGPLGRSLIALWDSSRDANWTNAVTYLRAATVTAG